MNIDRKQLSHLKRLVIFSTVIEQGSFAGAGKILGISASSVSEHIALLEIGIGSRLIHRTTRSLSLTSDGKKIYSEAKNIDTSLKNILSLAESDQICGDIRISISHDMALDWLNPLLEKFLMKYPQISFDLKISDFSVNLITEQIDLAIRVSASLNESLIARPIFSDKLKIFAGKEYIKENGTPKNINDLRNSTWIILPQLGSENKVTIIDKSKQITFVPKHYHTCNSPQVVIDMVKRNMGLTLLLPKVSVKGIGNKLKLIMPSIHSSSFTFSIVYQSRRQLPLRVRLFLEFLHENK